MKQAEKKCGILTVGILLVIAAAFFLTGAPVVHRVIARAASLPAYQTAKDGVCLVSSYDGPLSALVAIAERASAAKVPLGVGVSAWQIRDDPASARRVMALGHTLALRGIPPDAGATPQSWTAQSDEALEVFLTYTDVERAMYMPHLGQHRADDARFCSRHGLVYLLSGKDTRAYEAKTQQDFAKALSDNAQRGDIIYIGLDAAIDFAAIAERFAAREIPLLSIGDALFD